MKEPRTLFSFSRRWTAFGDKGLQIFIIGGIALSVQRIVVLLLHAFLMALVRVSVSS